MGAVRSEAIFAEIPQAMKQGISIYKSRVQTSKQGTFGVFGRQFCLAKKHGNMAVRWRAIVSKGQSRILERFFRDLDVLCDRSATDTDRTGNLTVGPDRDPATECREAAASLVLNAVTRFAGQGLG